RDPSLPVHVGVRPQVRRVECNILRRPRIRPVSLEKLLVLPPHGHWVYLCNTAVEARDKQLTLRKTVKKLLESCGKLQPALVVETRRVHTARRLDRRIRC